MADGKHVRSAAPGAGPRDLSGSLARQRDGNDAKVTEPPGGWPAIVGGNPDRGAGRLQSDDAMTGVATTSPGPYSLSTSARMTGPAANMAQGSY